MDRPAGMGGWLVDQALFRLLLDFELHKAQRLRYSVSILALELPSVGNGESLTTLTEAIAHRLRGTDAVAVRTQGSLVLLLIDAEVTHLPLIVERLTSRLGAVGWSAGGSSYPRTATRTEDMLRQAIDMMERAKNEGGDRLYVAS